MNMADIPAGMVSGGPGYADAGPHAGDGRLPPLGAGLALGCRDTEGRPSPWA